MIVHGSDTTSRPSPFLALATKGLVPGTRSTAIDGFATRPSSRGDLEVETSLPL
jgi:hypothetical protein